MIYQSHVGLSEAVILVESSTCGLPTMSRSLLRIAAFVAAAANIAAAKGAAEAEVLLGEGSCTSGFTFSGFTDTRLNGDYIAFPFLGWGNQSQPTYGKDGGGEFHMSSYPYGIRITSIPQPLGLRPYYIPGKSWSIYYQKAGGAYYDILLAWCVPGVDGCPEVTATALWPSSVGSIKWNVVVDPDAHFEDISPPTPPNKTTLNSGVSTSCCELAYDKCVACDCSQKISLKLTCTWSPFSTDSCRKDCCYWYTEPTHGGSRCLNGGGKNWTYPHCNHSSGPITEASAVSKQSEFSV